MLYSLFSDAEEDYEANHEGPAAETREDDEPHVRKQSQNNLDN